MKSSTNSPWILGQYEQPPAAGRLEVGDRAFQHVAGAVELVIVAEVGPAVPDLAADVRKFEPIMALISGRTGFEAIDAIIRDAPTHLEAGGWLVLEHGWKQGDGVRQRLVRQGFVHVRLHADLAGHERVTEGQWPGTQRG